MLRRCWWPLLQADIQAFRKRERPPKKAAPVDCSQHHADAVPDFLNGRVLRNYQTDSLQWMMLNFRQNRSCILGDEMVCLSRPEWRVCNKYANPLLSADKGVLMRTSSGTLHPLRPHDIILALLCFICHVIACMLCVNEIEPTVSRIFLMQGLGKTAQSIATLAFQKQFLGVTGPHIVIAPLTTLGHWRREIQTWTDMVCGLDHVGAVPTKPACAFHHDALF